MQTVEEVGRRERGLEPETEVREEFHGRLASSAVRYPPNQGPRSGSGTPRPFRKTTAQKSVRPAASASAGPQRNCALAAALTTTSTRQRDRQTRRPRTRSAEPDDRRP